VRVLDEVFKAFEEGDGKSVCPHDKARVPIESKDLVQGLDVLTRVVEELVSMVKGCCLRDHVEEIKLSHSESDTELQDAFDDRHVLLIDHHIDVHDQLSSTHSPNHALDQPRKGSGVLGEMVVKLLGVAMKGKGDLAEACSYRLLVKIGVGKHPPVGDRLDTVVPELSSCGDQLMEARVERGLATADDDLVGIEFFASSSKFGDHLIEGQE
jgi:hypothetical protein